MVKKRLGIVAQLDEYVAPLSLMTAPLMFPRQSFRSSSGGN
jgi:hypothetical protein